jgi:hypothetical protein
MMCITNRRSEIIGENEDGETIIYKKERLAELI